MTAPPTYADWSARLLSRLAPSAPPARAAWLIAWAQLEDTRARFNPLATTEPAHLATDYNAAGVKNYVTLADGIAAAADTLSPRRPHHRQYGYDRILTALARPGSRFADFRGAVSASAWSGLPRDGKHYLIPDHDPAWDDRPLPTGRPE